MEYVRGILLMLRPLQFALVMCVLALGGFPLYAAFMGDEGPVASHRLSVSKVRSSEAGTEFSIRTTAPEPSSDELPDPRVDVQARPFSAGLLWVLPAGTDEVNVEIGGLVS